MLGNSTIWNALAQMPRKLSCKLELSNSNTITDVKLLTYNSDWTGNITIGQVVSSYINVTVPTPIFALAGLNVTLYMGVTISNAVTWTQIGVFRIDEKSIRTRQGYTSFKAYDKLYNTVNSYHTSLTYPTAPAKLPLQSIFNEVCQQIGLTSPYLTLTYNPEFSADSEILEMLDGYNLRDVLGFIAAYQGKNLYYTSTPTNAGTDLQFRWFSSASYTADGTKANVPYIGENNSTVARLICQTADGVLTSGIGEGIYFTCLFMGQSRLAAMVSGLSLTYRKADVDIPYGNYCLQSGDIITVTTVQNQTLSVPIMNNSWTYDGGLSSTVAAYDVSDYSGTANNAERSLSVRRVQRQMAVNRATSDLKAASEKITGASGGYIRINFGGDGKTAALLIMDTEDISTAQNVWVFNQEGLGHFPNGYGVGDVNIALTADGWVAAERISGELIKGVGIVNTDDSLTYNPQIHIADGSIDINESYTDPSTHVETITPVGRIKYRGQASQDDVDKIAIEVEHGNWFAIGEYNNSAFSTKYVYRSVPDGNNKMHHFYGDVKFFDGVYIGDSLLSTENIVKIVDGGAKNLLKNYIEHVHQWNTWGTWNNNTWTITAGGANITITFWADNSLTVSGTSGTANIYISYGALNLVNGKRYTLSGCPAGGGTTKYCLYTGTWYAWDCYGEPNTVEYNSSTMGAMYIFLAKNQTFNDLVFKPMICTEDDWKVSQAYQPWRPTYQELYERVILLEQRVTALENQ